MTNKNPENLNTEDFAASDSVPPHPAVRFLGQPSPLLQSAVADLGLNWHTVPPADLATLTGPQLAQIIPADTTAEATLRQARLTTAEDAEDFPVGTRCRFKADITRAGEAQPEWSPAYDPEYIQHWAAKVPPPHAINNDRDLLGQKEHRLNDPADAPLVYAQTANNDAPWITIEEWIHAPTCDVYGWIQNGATTIAAIAELHLAPKPHRFPVEAVTPATLDPQLERALRTRPEFIYHAVDFQRGVFRMRFIHHPERGPLIMSAAFGLNEILHPVDTLHICGIANLTQTAIAIANGETPTPPRHPKAVCAIQWLTARSGQVTAIEGEDTARNIEGIHAVHITAQPGDKIGHTINEHTRNKLGYVTALAPTLQQARDRANETARACLIRTTALI